MSTNGKKIYPAQIEALFKMEPVIHQTLLVGDKLPYVAALFTLNRPVLETLEYLKKETKVWLEITTLLIPGVHTRWVSLYAVPMMLGAAHFWSVRKGFFFTAGGCELPLVWAVMLLVQAILGDGAFAVSLASLGPSCERLFRTLDRLLVG